MGTNKYNRGMPIIKRHKLGEPLVDQLSESTATPASESPKPIEFVRRREQSRVRALKMRVHTFFWTLAS